MIFTDNPVADFERYDAEQENRLKELPICSDCGEPIQDEHYFEFDCYFYCEDCLSNHRKYTEDFVGD
jgi:hypothetical protein